jgi:hypothetical protein
MGVLRTFNLEELIRRYDAHTFFETGTAAGTGVEEASKKSFNKIYSVEIIEHQAQLMREKFAYDKRISIIAGDSISVMKDLLPQIDDNIIFWLDAHFPGADLGFRKFDEEQDDDLRLPLDKELQEIKSLRPNNKDVIIFDDLFLYKENGKYIKQIWGDRFDLSSRKKFSSDYFYMEIFSETHDFSEIKQEEGYGILIPK